jgi:glucokinase
VAGSGTAFDPVLRHGGSSSPEEAIRVYLKEEGLKIGDIGAVCLSVAGPVSGDEFASPTTTGA